MVERTIEKSFNDVIYSTKLKSLFRKLKTLGFDVDTKIEVIEENLNDNSANYNVFAYKSDNKFKINVDIYEGKHTTITVKNDENKVVFQGEGKSFNSALSTFDEDFSINESTQMLNEGPGAGYKITIKDLTIVNKPQITKEKGSYHIIADVEYDADAEGYDWSSEYIIKEIIGIEKDTYKGQLNIFIKDIPDIWEEMDKEYFEDDENPTEEEKMNIITNTFRKNAYFNDFNTIVGGGYVHKSIDNSYYVYLTTDYDGFSEIQFGEDKDTWGYLTIDKELSEDIEFAHSYNRNLYNLVTAIQDYANEHDKELSWSEEIIYDFVGPYVTDSKEYTEDYIKDIISEMEESGCEITDI